MDDAFACACPGQTPTVVSCRGPCGTGGASAGSWPHLIVEGGLLVQRRRLVPVRFQAHRQDGRLSQFVCRSDLLVACVPSAMHVPLRGAHPREAGIATVDRYVLHSVLRSGDRFFVARSLIDTARSNWH